MSEDVEKVTKAMRGPWHELRLAVAADLQGRAREVWRAWVAHVKARPSGQGHPYPALLAAADEVFAGLEDGDWGTVLDLLAATAELGDAYDAADEDLIEGLATLRDYWREFEKAVHVFEPPVEAAHEGETEEEWNAWWDAWRRGRSRE